MHGLNDPLLADVAHAGAAGYTPDRHGLRRVTSQGTWDHLLPHPETRALPGGTWGLVRPVGLRSAGLPAELLSELVADPGDPAIGHSPGARIRWSSERLKRAVEDPRFEEALAWQNPNVLHSARSFAMTPPNVGRNAKHRDREFRLVRYLTRYTAKTETIGFFGPIGYVFVDETQTGVVQKPSVPAVAGRLTALEPWAVQSIGQAIAELPEAANWLHIRRRSAHAIHAGSSGLNDIAERLIRICDGQITRAEVIKQTASHGPWEIDEVTRQVTQLLERGELIESWNIPLTTDATDTLTAALESIPNVDDRAALRQPLVNILDDLRELDLASGDPDLVVKAQTQLAEGFREITGKAATRRPGQMYAGRLVAYQEAFRNGQVRMGALAFDPLVAPLEGMLTIARWVTWAGARAYRRHYVQCWGDRHGEPLTGVWNEIVRDFYGASAPKSEVLAELRLRWQEVMGSEENSLTDPDEFLSRCLRVFGAPGPGWSGAAIHSPDVQMVSVGGEQRFVLSELHIAAATLQGELFEWPMRNDQNFTKLAHEITGTQYVPMFPAAWPRSTGRVSPSLPLPGDTTFAFADVQGGPPETVSIGDIRLDIGSGPTPGVRLPDGTQVAFEEFFASFLSAAFVDALKELHPEAHTPRQTVGELVIAREGWRLPLGDEAFTRDQPEDACLVAVENWRQEHDLPEALYARITGETKPVFVDFRMPLTVLALRRSVRAAIVGGRAGEEFAVSEALPHPADSWLLDANGDRFPSELRMMFVDPLRTSKKGGGEPIFVGERLDGDVHG